MSTVAKTQIQVTFLDVHSGSFPSLYDYPSPGKLKLASMNAGNSRDLYVGGDGINGAFAKDLGKAGQTTDDYEARHQALLAKATASGTAFESYSKADPMVFSFVLASTVSNVSGWHEGVCFVDVFGAGYYPGGDAANAAMLYVAPPHGDHYATVDDFLTAITKTATNAALTAAGYNAVAQAQGQPPIDVLRACAFSSGIFNSKHASLNAIARAIFAGLTMGLQAGPSGLTEVQFPVTPPLFYILEDDLATPANAAAPPPSI